MILKDKKYAILFLTPALALIAVFLFNPLIQTVYYSFTDWRQFSSKREFTGLANYSRLVHDAVVMTALKNTLLFIIICIIFQVVFSLFLSVLVDGIKTGSKFYRTVFFFPVVISGSAIGLMFFLAYLNDGGLLNNLLISIGKKPIVWLTEDKAAILSQIPYIWQMVGFYFVIFITALTKIPSEIYESAALDGATGLRKSIYITIPLLKDVVMTCIALVIASAIKAFDIVFTITGGGPLDSSQLLSTYIYEITFQMSNQGYGCTLAIAMIIIGIALTLLTSLLNRGESVNY